MIVVQDLALTDARRYLNESSVGHHHCVCSDCQEDLAAVLLRFRAYGIDDALKVIGHHSSLENRQAELMGMAREIEENDR